MPGAGGRGDARSPPGLPQPSRPHWSCPEEGVRPPLLLRRLTVREGEGRGVSCLCSDSIPPESVLSAGPPPLTLGRCREADWGQGDQCRGSTQQRAGSG